MKCLRYLIIHSIRIFKFVVSFVITATGTVRVRVYKCKCVMRVRVHYSNALCCCNALHVVLYIFNVMHFNTKCHTLPYAIIRYTLLNIRVQVLYIIINFCE